jgi:hypothetical protein
MAWAIEVFDGGTDLIWHREPDRGPVLARDAHVGARFRARAAYAEYTYDAAVLLTAEYGFLLLDDRVPGPYDPAFDRPGAVSVETLREQIRTLYLDQMTLVLNNVDDLKGRAFVAAAFSETTLEIRDSPERTLEEEIRAAEEIAAALADRDG